VFQSEFFVTRRFPFDDLWNPRQRGSLSMMTDASIDSRETKRRYVPRAEGRILLVDATIDLLRELPFSQVTVRKVAERADLNVMAITNIFGSQQELFVAVTQELADRFATMMASLPDDQVQVGMLFDENFVLRTRLVAWLIGQGVDPGVFKVDPSHRLGTVFMARQITSGSDEEQAWLFAQLLQYIGEGFIVFQDTHDRRDGDLLRGAALLGRIRDELPRLAEGL